MCLVEGLVGAARQTISTENRRFACRGLIRATLHMVNREFDALADDFVELGLLPTGANRQA